MTEARKSGHGILPFNVGSPILVLFFFKIGGLLASTATLQIRKKPSFLGVICGVSSPQISCSDAVAIHHCSVNQEPLQTDGSVPFETRGRINGGMVWDLWLGAGLPAKHAGDFCTGEQGASVSTFQPRS